MRPSTIRLNQEQETDLTEFVERMVKELDRDNDERIKADRKADTDYRNQKKTRAQPGTLFEQCNFSVPMTSWVVDHFSARTEDELLSRDPFVRFEPQGTADDEVARAIHRLAAYKLFDKGTVKTDLQKAVYPMFAHRIGQQRPVTVYRLVTQGSIEDRIVQLHQRKRALAEGVLTAQDGDEADAGGSAVMDAAQMLALLRGDTA